MRPKKKVLYAADIGSIEIPRFALSTRGFSVQGATNLNILELARLYIPDVVVLDYSSPEIQSIFLSELKAIAAVPIIVIGLPANSENTDLYDVDATLTSTASMEDLISLLKLKCARKRRPRPAC